MNKYLYKFTSISVRDKLDLFDKLISPILNYSSEVWGFISGNAVERIHVQFCIKVLGVKKTTQNDFIYGELGRMPYQYHRYFTIIKYWLKLLYSKEHKYIKKVYLMLKSDLDTQPNKKNWCSLVRDLLCQLGFHEVWIFQEIGETKLFLSIAKQRIKDQFLQNWNGRLSNSSRANLYKHISNFKLQSYLNILNITKFRVSITRLRVSSHRLRIETGRWAKPHATPVNERTCSECNVLDDEYHFVCECTLFDEFRKTYIPVYYRRRPNMFKFIELMCNENKQIIKKLSIFIHKAFQLRQTNNINR